MDTKNDAGKPRTGWAELILSLLSRSERPSATVHPLDAKGDEPCFALSIDKQLLCGADGRIALFDSLPAAARFLAMINVQGFSYGEFPGRDLAERMARQCFQLGKHGLTACRECAWRDAVRPAPAKECFSWLDEDWSRWDDEEY